jgi:hypothetical protein
VAWAHRAELTVVAAIIVLMVSEAVLNQRLLVEAGPGTLRYAWR